MTPHIASRNESSARRFRIDRLEERIAPSANLNPGQNNTNNPGDEPGNGGGGGNPGNNNPGENNTNNPGNETP